MRRHLIIPVLLAAAWVLAGLHGSGLAAKGSGIPAAVFPFALDDTSRVGMPSQYEPPSHADAARMVMMDRELRDILENAGYVSVDLALAQAKVGGRELRTCGGCEAALAVEAGAKVSVIGWVQKVSNLILNINLVMRDAASGRVLRAGSVDIRGDTDESWQRGLRYLFSESILPSGKGTPE